MKLVTYYKSVVAFARHGVSHVADENGEAACGQRPQMPFTRDRYEGSRPTCRRCIKRLDTAAAERGDG